MHCPTQHSTHVPQTWPRLCATLVRSSCATFVVASVKVLAARCCCCRAFAGDSKLSLVAPCGLVATERVALTVALASLWDRMRVRVRCALLLQRRVREGDRQQRWPIPRGSLASSRCVQRRAPMDDPARARAIASPACVLLGQRGG